MASSSRAGYRSASCSFHKERYPTRLGTTAVQELTQHHLDLLQLWSPSSSAWSEQWQRSRRTCCACTFGSSREWRLRCDRGHVDLLERSCDRRSGVFRGRRSSRETGRLCVERPRKNRRGGRVGLRVVWCHPCISSRKLDQSVGACKYGARWRLRSESKSMKCREICRPKGRTCANIEPIGVTRWELPSRSSLHNINPVG